MNALLDQILRKTEQAVKNHAVLTQQIGALQQQMAALKALLEEQQQINDELERTLQHVTAAGTLTQAHATNQVAVAALKSQIAQLVKQIDRCTLLLENSLKNN